MAFIELHRGAEPIGYADLMAWQTISRVELTVWEAETIMAMDRTALVELNAKD